MDSGGERRVRGLLHRLECFGCANRAGRPKHPVPHQLVEELRRHCAVYFEEPRQLCRRQGGLRPCDKMRPCVGGGGQGGGGRCGGFEGEGQEWQRGHGPQRGGKLASVHRFYVGTCEWFASVGVDLHHLDHVFAHRQHVSAPCDVFDQKFADHLVAQRVAQPFDPCGPCCFFAVDRVAPRDHPFDLRP